MRQDILLVGSISVRKNKQINVHKGIDVNQRMNNIIVESLQTLLMILKE